MAQVHSLRCDNTTQPKRRGNSDRLSISEVTALVAIVVALIVAAVTAGAPAPEVSMASVKVAHGDSLWSIAQTHPIAGLTTAQTVDLIAEKNGLSHSGVVPGAVILAPAEDAAGAVAMR